MATVSWLGGTGNWLLNPTDWSTTMAPGAGDDVVISVAGSNVTLNGATSVGSITLGVASAILNIQNATGPDFVSGGLLNSGTLNVDNNGNYNEGGSSLTIGGVLTNTKTVQIGNSYLGAATNVTFGGLNNFGSFNISGGTTLQSTVTITGAATNSGTLTLTGSSKITVAAGNTFTQAAGRWAARLRRPGRMASRSAACPPPSAWRRGEPCR